MAWLEQRQSGHFHIAFRFGEELRSQLDDIDLDAGIITIREKKRVRGKLTTRTVPISPLLSIVLKGWFDEHPGGQFTFCHEANVPRSKARRDEVERLGR